MMLLVNVEKKSFRSIVSQLAAVYNFSVHSMNKGEFIRESLGARGFYFLFSESGIIGLIHFEHNDIKMLYKRFTPFVN